MFDALKEKIAGKNIRLVFPEAMDPRILGAVVRLKRENLLEPVLIGNPAEIEKSAKEKGFDLTGIEIYDPESYDK